MKTEAAFARPSSFPAICKFFSAWPDRMHDASTKVYASQWRKSPSMFPKSFFFSHRVDVDKIENWITKSYHFALYVVCYWAPESGFHSNVAHLTVNVNTEQEHIRNEDHSYGSSAALITLMKMRREQKNMLNMANSSFILCTSTWISLLMHTHFYFFFFSFLSCERDCPERLRSIEVCITASNNWQPKPRHDYTTPLQNWTLFRFGFFSCERNFSNTQRKITVRSTAHTLISHSIRLSESNESRYNFAAKSPMSMMKTPSHVRRHRS